MKRLYTASLVALALVAGCASTHRGRAIQVGSVAKEIVDAGAVLTTQHLDDKAKECEKYVGEGTAALTVCLGPVASKPDQIDATFEAVRAAQLGLFMAVSADSDASAVKAARADLEAAVRDLVALIQAIRTQEAK